jgi:hypothetical protein
MGSDLSQFEIPGQLLTIGSPSRADKSTDIGEAKITHTIFGKAKVRVIREQDRVRRTWLIVALAVVVVSTASWQGWIALQQMKNAAPPLPLSERVLVSPPAFRPEYPPVNVAPALAPAPMASKPGASVQPGIIKPEINNPAATQKIVPQQPLVKPPMQTAAKPVTPQQASKPQAAAVNSQAASPQSANAKSAPLAATGSPAKIQAVAKQPTKLLPPKRPVAPVVAKPSAVLPVKPTVATPLAAKSAVPAVVAAPAGTQAATTKPATTKPADVAPLAQPSGKESAPAPSPAITNQSLGPINAQPPVNPQPQGNTQP